MRTIGSITTSAFLFLAMFQPSYGQSPIGIGGIAEIESGGDTSSLFLVIHDHKYNKHTANLSRFGIVVVPTKHETKEKVRYIAVNEDWKKFSKKGNDLEAICALPNRKNEFLAIESSYYKGDYGRIFHLTVSESRPFVWDVAVTDSTLIPGFINETTDLSVEGLSCVANGTDAVHLIIGFRSGSTITNSILWDKLNLKQWPKRLVFANTLPFSADISDRYSRDISDLHVDKAGRLWIAASYDIDNDQGPFASAVYLAGRVKSSPAFSVDLLQKPIKISEFQGLKIEALGPPVTPAGILSYGTDDEVYGGILRQLYWR